MTGQSEQSTTTEAQKQNVVLVIDVSGSMNTMFKAVPYTYSQSTYGNHSAYYVEASGGDYVQVVYEWHLLGGTGWYTTGVPIKIGGLIAGTLGLGTTVYYGETRLDATKRAANAVVDALLAYNTNDDNITDMFEISVVKFANKLASQGGNESLGYNGTKTIISKSTDAEAIKNAINGLEAGGGTNWQAALEQAKAEADGELTGTDEKTSVIFLTDGFPTFYGNDNGTGGESDDNIPDSYANARGAARTLVSSGYTLYNIFAFGSDTTTHNGHTGYEYLCGLTNYAYGTGSADNWSKTTDEVKNYCFNAKNPQSLIDTFTTIVAHITNNVGYGGVSISDGVSLGATSTSVAVNGAAKTETMRYSVKDASKKTVFTMTIDETGKATFVIPNGDGTNTTLVDDASESVSVDINGVTKTSAVYSVTQGTGESAKTYSMSPATIDAGTGMVKWDLSGLGILANGYTYTVAFDVWPNQLAYDIAADLNNGIYTSVDAALTAYKVTDATERQHIKDALHKNKDGSYSLYTNYQQKVEYYPATQVIDDSGNEDWSYGDKQEENLEQPSPIPLQGSLLPLRKIWEAGIDAKEYNELLWEDGQVDGTPKKYSINLYVWKADTETALETMVNTGVTATNQPYITKQLGWDEDSRAYVWEKDVAVAPGTMVNLAEAIKLGYDPDNNPDKVRTFTDNEGTAREYYVIEEGHYYYVTEDGSDLHFELNTVLYHPMIVDGTLYNVGFGPDQNVERMDPMYAVVATNKLKGGLNISKVVSTTQIAVQDGEIKNVTEPKDDDGVKTVTDEMTYEIKLWKEDDGGKKSAVYTYDDQIDNGEAMLGSIGYRILSGPSLNDDEIQYAEGIRGSILEEDSDNAGLANGNFATIAHGQTTITLTMPANGEIRIVNLPAGTKYSVKEIVDGVDAYNYSATESKTQEGTQVKEGTITTANNVSGTIKGDTLSMETFYNWAANFYVYHSSDNTIEKISFADPRVKGTYEDGKYNFEFNIVNETKSGYLYGGYYKSFGQQKATGDQITGKAEEGNLVYTTDSEKETETEYDGKHKGGIWAADAGGATPYTGSMAKAWKPTITTKNDNVYTVKGTEMTPSSDTVYYLKEVPDTYLRPYMSFVYHYKQENRLVALRLITAVDDANYKKVGFYVTHDDEETKVPVPNLAATLKIANADGTSSILTAKKAFNAVPRGYLSCSDQTALLQQAGNYAFTMAQYYITPDGVTVEGDTLRTINIGNKKFVDDGNGKGKEPGIRLVGEAANERKKPEPLYYCEE